MSEEKGICIFAYNNEQIDYIKLSIICSLLCKKNLGLPVALITDSGTEGYLETFNKSLIDACFDYIITKDHNYDPNKRIHKDSPWHEFVAPFYNYNKSDIFNISPFNQTLLLDSDYLVLTDNLLKLFDQDIHIACFEHSKTIGNENVKPLEIFLHDTGIKMLWSTVIYFDKQVNNKLFFDVWGHVRDNYEYYQLLYGFPKGIYRTDYAISIANHILGGRNGSKFIYTPTQQYMYTSYQEDDLCKVGENSLLFLKNDPKKNWLDIAVNWKNKDVHVMNKRAILRNYETFLDHYI